MSFNIDSRGILVDALKQDPEVFQLSNLILPNKSALRAVYELENIRAKMLEFAKNPDVGIQMLGPPPKAPNLSAMEEEEAERAKMEYLEMQRMYEHEKLALTMHVPYGDMILINSFLEKFRKTLYATSAVKGRRFFAFTKQVEEEQGGMLDFLKRGSGSQPV